MAWRERKRGVRGQEKDRRERERKFRDTELSGEEAEGVIVCKGCSGRGGRRGDCKINEVLSRLPRG